MDYKEKPTASASDHLANERTFLAWIRTSIALMGFGFVVVKFSLFIKQLSAAFASQPAASKGFSAIIGILLVIIGAGTALIGYTRYKRIERQLLNQDYKPSSGLLLLLTIVIIGGAIILVYYLVPNL